MNRQFYLTKCTNLVAKKLLIFMLKGTVSEIVRNEWSAPIPFTSMYLTNDILVNKKRQQQS
jgi:hypothetical protein